MLNETKKLLGDNILSPIFFFLIPFESSVPSLAEHLFLSDPSSFSQCLDSDVSIIENGNNSCHSRGSLAFSTFSSSSTSSAYDIFLLPVIF